MAYPGHEGFDSARAEDSLLRASGLSIGDRFEAFYSGRVFIVKGRGTRLYADTQVDHVLPLRLAFDWGGVHWLSSKWHRFVNDLGNLVLADPDVNRDKSDLDAAHWTPPEHAAARASIALRTIAIWGLTPPHDVLKALDRAWAKPGIRTVS